MTPDDAPYSTAEDSLFGIYMKMKLAF